MEKEQINSNTQEGSSPWYKKLLFIALILGTVLFLIGLIRNSMAGTIVQAGYNFFTKPVDQVNSFEGRVNVLVMGKAGGMHEGPDLTDTMILVSIGISKPSIILVSLPRDLWIPEIRAKINSAYYWGKNGSPYLDVSEMGGGVSFAEIIAGEVVGKQVQYGAVIDFSSFKDIVDALGGIRVDVKNGFTDKLYPIEGRENDTCGEDDPTFACRYMNVSFNAGVQVMNGDTALEFVRSRHAEGVEGTDVAREARQQKVIDAIKNRILDPKVFLSLKTDLALINIIKKYVETNINLPTAGILARLVFDARGNIVQYLMPQGLLVNPPIDKTYDNQYVFVPKLGNGKWADVNSWFASIVK